MCRRNRQMGGSLEAESNNQPDRGEYLVEWVDTSFGSAFLEDW